MKIIKIDPKNPDLAIKEAITVLKAGRLVAYPTESFYAIGADAMNELAVRRVFKAKVRELGKPLPIIIHDRSEVPKYTGYMGPGAENAVLQLMPGPVTLVFYASEDLPAELIAGTRKVGIRVPRSRYALYLAEALGGPITATSANLSGEDGLTDPEEVARAFAGSVDVVLDGGVTPGPPASTLLDVTVEPPFLIRVGGLSRAEVEKAVGKVMP